MSCMPILMVFERLFFAICFDTYIWHRGVEKNKEDRDTQMNA